ncbi:helix-turn-helix domain-containing protein [Pseudomonas cremoricolorata]|uniref:AraC family transcriptional regulator n=1 Tax=Pseudomonas cremoricolorata TaxID=157783 RepID=A0A089WP64_9PSED|nr:helix-turn-helix domain-containing protein [Pseudomonas cremoricolorata]AIR91085.1 AraC family transcriptional regulator [Pseudomonas cremoricolorata]
MFVETRRFHDSQQHAGSIAGWDQVYAQIERGPLTSQLTQACGTGFQVFREVLDKRVLQQGRAPRGRLCIALSLEASFPPLIQGQQVADGGVALLRDGEEFTLHAPAGSQVLAANIDQTRFARHAALELSEGQRQRLRSASQVALSGAPLQRLRQRLSALLEAPGLPEAQIQEQLLEAFLDLFQLAEDDVRSRRGNLAVSAYLVRRSQELLQQQPDQPLSILDICHSLRVSRRTLQNSFQQVTGLRPLEYLRNVRLNSVRRTLLSTRAEQCNVSEVAWRQGFFHLSHFAAHYRALFGECPSATRRHDA